MNGWCQAPGCKSPTSAGSDLWCWGHVDSPDGGGSELLRVWEVGLERTAYQCATVQVRATNREDAEQQARDAVDPTDWDTESSDVHVADVCLVVGGEGVAPPVEPAISEWAAAVLARDAGVETVPVSEAAL